jgi:heme/copper-type cytochrome/quinol oxidase subunit 2
MATEYVFETKESLMNLLSNLKSQATEIEYTKEVIAEPMLYIAIITCIISFLICLVIVHYMNSHVDKNDYYNGNNVVPFVMFVFGIICFASVIVAAYYFYQINFGYDKALNILSTRITELEYLITTYI